ncbi:hypothetical protein [Siphonobacter aquaeclarae]|uniref:Uncharacterized protein n=1 Tax=Siphonobacter aquaeclarae TaxID=563176 RepID=A0A1G9TB10_9BACT|nr:hypothetical protein [Siphonobacter aquaeclarae]SDM44325.1 hypothetical protein SAMN04488090_3470 [Siphonobacter aquaeclarae]
MVKPLYNVGWISVAGVQHNLYYCENSDGKKLFAILQKDDAAAAESTAYWKYLSRDYVASQEQTNNAYVVPTFDYTSFVNEAAPSFVASGKISDVTNVASAQVRLYTGQPFFSLKGTGVADYTPTTSGLDLSTNTGTTTTTNTGILTSIGLGGVDDFFRKIDPLLLILGVILVYLFIIPKKWKAKLEKMFK